ncbi:hypothetical protein BIV24_29470 [Streptomyces colonosanans]|uniref:Chaplin domain-containing protein n=1 Tax=Streptomyces colonosanans TaxID=1428652 RepID=A0A1S2NUZ9_9ACTN|nr:hypothetical protein BIV24_29470 [Streptomyces colonosanans]
MYADSQADGATTGSPGIASGNTLQIPVHIPINLCGNSVDVVGALNPAFGNACANRSDSPGPATVPLTPATPDTPADTPREIPDTPAVPATSDTPDTPAVPATSDTPADTPRDDDTVDHGGSSTPPQVPADNNVTPRGTTNQPPHRPVTTPIGSSSVPSSHKSATLAQTGSEDMLAASAVSVAMLAGGLILYRRARAVSRW